MYTVELYARVRRAVLVEGKSRRAVAREFGLAFDGYRLEPVINFIPL
jgi:hypothetical protein